MRHSSKLSATFLCAASVVALSTAAWAQQADNVETVVVTGSRVISDAANSPTPLTVMSTEQLQTTTPSDVPDALNKLPVFQGSSTPRSINNASQNNAGNVLSLRGFGGNRTLILLDGHRVAPSNSNGTVDTDVLPQMLMSRVEVVTGGASAVYGSDAVTGVVNFVLDKHFNGVKYEANAGISNYGDGASYKAGIAAGTDLFGGKGHIEASFRHYHSDNIKNDARIEGQQVWSQIGLGTTAAPFDLHENSRLASFSYGGKITCAGTTANPCAANGQQFVQNGVIGPFFAGTPTSTSGVNTGGDGTNTTVSNMTAMLTTEEAFSRFSYDLDDNTTFYIQGTAAQSSDLGNFQNNYIQTGNVPNTFYKNNPFLPATAQALLAGGTAGTFQLAKYINNQGSTQGFQTDAIDRNLSFTTGVDGTIFGDYAWGAYYTHGESRLMLDDKNNQNNQKMFASEDAVLNSSGQAVCYASLSANPTIAAEYKNCVPMNPFGPTALSSDAYNYFLQDSHFITNNIMDDVGGSITGDVYKGIGAGPIRAALSAEYRVLDYSVTSNALPTDTIDCTGLRLCNTSVAFWQGNIANNTPAVSNNVWELAAEADIPLLKDSPLVQSLTLNLAGRFTDYSSSGAVQTWKIGLNWHINDDFYLRGTNSVDIRAPTLSDLYGPVQVTHTGYTDLHTGNQNNTTLTSSQGNPNLVPEVARTYTGGVVFTPTFVPGFTASVDYYRISLTKGIGAISASSSSTQQICESSGGLSPFCALYLRPYEFADHDNQNGPRNNYPYEILSTSLNTSSSNIEGWDIEVNYNTQMSDIWSSAPGSLSFRALYNYQPVSESVSYPGAPLNIGGGIAKSHVTAFLGYKVGSWRFDLQDRWIGGYSRVSLYGDPTSPTVNQVYAIPRVQTRNYDDVTITRDFNMQDGSFEAYLSVQNVGNIRPPIVPTNAANPGLYFLGIQGSGVTYDAIGRYFTIGMRANL